MSTMRTGVLLVVLLAAAAAGSAAAAGAAQRNRPSAAAATAVPQKDGWWIRVNGGSVAPNLYWRFGTQGRLGAPINWTRGQNPEEFDLPAAQRQLPALDIAALSLPPDQVASFCVFFRDQGISLFEFTREKNLAVNQNMRAPECMP
jgi:hypothetical protein